MYTLTSVSPAPKTTPCVENKTPHLENRTPTLNIKNIIANNIGICFFKILLSENCLPAKAELIKIINKGNIVHRTARTNNPF